MGILTDLKTGMALLIKALTALREANLSEPDDKTAEYASIAKINCDRIAALSSSLCAYDSDPIGMGDVRNRIDLAFLQLNPRLETLQAVLNDIGGGKATTTSAFMRSAAPVVGLLKETGLYVAKIATTAVPLDVPLQLLPSSD